MRNLTTFGPNTILGSLAQSRNAQNILAACNGHSFKQQFFLFCSVCFVVAVVFLFVFCCVCFILFLLFQGCFFILGDRRIIIPSKQFCKINDMTSECSEPSFQYRRCAIVAVHCPGGITLLHPPMYPFSVRPASQPTCARTAYITPHELCWVI